MRHIIYFAALVLLVACAGERATLESAPSAPDGWTAYNAALIEKGAAKDLKNWWARFDDNVLDQLVAIALSDSPTKRIAAARIAEARGIQRSSRAGLMPQIGASGTNGRQETVSIKAGDYYDASFDASFELDFFGALRKRVEADGAIVAAREAQYHDVTLTLIADVARAYIDYRGYEKQAVIAQSNYKLQSDTLRLIKRLRDAGEESQLSVEQGAALVNATLASVAEFERQKDNARLQLSVLVGRMPDVLVPLLSADKALPHESVKVALRSPVEVLSLRPDIRAAQAELMAASDLADASFRDLFPAFSLSGFYGVADNALVSSTAIWSAAANAAVRLLDFGKIEGQIDAARAREIQAFEAYRAAVLGAVRDVETALVDYGRAQERVKALTKARARSAEAFRLSKLLYKEGEIAFLELLDSQRVLNDADSTLVAAQAQTLAAAIALYKSLGIY